MSRETRSIVDEAAAWLVRCHAGDLDAPAHAALQRWIERSTEHRRAWMAAQDLQQTFGQLPAQAALQALQRPRVSRRAVLSGGVLALAAVPTGWWAAREFPWNRWNAAYQTAAGEQHELVMADGSRVTLNTRTALDLIDTHERRGIVLHAGEILVQTAPDPERRRPFVVVTGQGEVQALGTRFTMREVETPERIRYTKVQVLEHAVRLQPRDTRLPLLIEAGQQGRLYRSHAEGPQTLAVGAGGWAQGQIIADNQPLSAFVEELSRYRGGVLRCDPAVADLRISGVFQTRDTDSALAIIEETLPVRLSARTRYWITVGPRS